jgi:pre-rRNA-processing protein TSR1
METDDEEAHIKPMDAVESEVDDSEGEEFETITVADDAEGHKYDEKMNEEEEAMALRKFQDARENELFPDEVDTPGNVPAKARFARYRGLKSFNDAVWDAKENLPSDFSRIFQFENFNRTRRRVLKESCDDDGIGADVGSFVRIHVKNVPRELFKFYESHSLTKPLVLYGLLQHEQKMSVLNLVLKQSQLFTGRIEAKERLVFHVGCRRFYANPIFSSHANGNKFKYERFMPTDEATVATIYAPITYAPASVVVFKEYQDGSQVLVATGSVLSVSPDRLVIKRIVLSGHPFKINSRNAVVRYMFHNREDILWFMPVELRSRYGRKGHIREPLGTHGHMKCTFNKPLTSQDTVMMNLYKRVFPKWTYEAVVRDPYTVTRDK